MFILGTLWQVIKVIFSRIIGKKQAPTWNLSTELIWATTRYTLISSNQKGLPWLKKMGASYKPKPKLGKQVDIQEMGSDSGKYLFINPKDIISERLIIYFHGGGYVTGSPRANIEFTTRLSIASSAKLVSPFYPTAPEARYPAAHRFAHQLVADILNEHPTKEIYLAGDSAGAALVLSAIKALNNPQKIHGCILISPWTEPTAVGGTIDSNSRSDVGDQAFLQACYQTYLDGQDPSSEFSLTFDASNLPQLPRTLLTVGTLEMLLDQVNRLHDQLVEKGVNVHFISYEDMFHTFWNMASTIKEANQIIEDISSWINQK